MNIPYLPTEEEFRPQYEGEGNDKPYYSYEQACKIIHRLSSDKTIPYRVDSDCAFKAELCLGRMMQWGIKPETLGEIFNLIPDLSPAGVKSAYASAGEHIMHHPPYEGLSFAERIMYTPSENITFEGQTAGDGNAITPRIRMGDTIFEPHPNGGIAIYSDKPNTPDDPHKEKRTFGDVLDVGQQFKFANHIMPTLRVFNHETKRVEEMVVDLGYDTKKPLPMQEWKQHQNYEESVIATAPLNHNFRINAELLSEPNFQRLREQLGVSGSSREEVAVLIKSLPQEQNDHVMILYFNLANSSLIGPLTSRSAPARTSEVLNNWIPLNERLLEPFVRYQQWVADTDEAHTRHKLSHREVSHFEKTTAHPSGVSKTVQNGKEFNGR